MFEEATKSHYRFPCAYGWISTEDLWGLPLISRKRDNSASLDEVAKNLHEELQNDEATSFVVDISPKNDEIAKKLELVKHIIKVRKKEASEALNQAARKAEKEQLLEILHGKKVDEMKGLSIEELKARIDAIS